MLSKHKKGTLPTGSWRGWKSRKIQYTAALLSAVGGKITQHLGNLRNHLKKKLNDIHGKDIRTQQAAFDAKSTFSDARSATFSWISLNRVAEDYQFVMTQLWDDWTEKYVMELFQDDYFNSDPELLWPEERSAASAATVAAANLEEEDDDIDLNELLKIWGISYFCTSVWF